MPAEILPQLKNSNFLQKLEILLQNKDELIKKAQNRVRKNSERYIFHGWEHSEYVADKAKEILRDYLDNNHLELDEKIKSQLAELIEIAAWYHDVVFGTEDKKDEQLSAAALILDMRELGTDGDLGKLLRGIISATQVDRAQAAPPNWGGASTIKQFDGVEDEVVRQNVLAQALAAADLFHFASDFDTSINFGVRFALETNSFDKEMSEASIWFYFVGQVLYYNRYTFPDEFSYFNESKDHNRDLILRLVGVADVSAAESIVNEVASSKDKQQTVLGLYEFYKNKVNLEKLEEIKETAQEIKQKHNSQS